MIDFEEAIKRLSAAQGVDRGTAVRLMKDAWMAKEPEMDSVSNVPWNLGKEYTESTLERAGVGALEFVDKTFDPLYHLTDKLNQIMGAPGGGAYPEHTEPDPSEILAQRVRETTPRVKYAEGVGELGGAAAIFPLAEEVAGAVPGLGGPGILPWAGRQIAAGATLERATTGQNTWLGSVVAPIVLPPAIGVAAGLIGKGLGVAGRAIFGRELPTEALPGIESIPPPSHIEPAQVIGRTVAAPPPEGRAPTPTAETNLEAGMRSIIGSQRETPSETSQTLSAAGQVFRPGDVAPQKAGFKKTAEDLLAERERASQTYVGTANTRTGQPFEGERTRLLSTDRGRVYVNENSPLSGLGQPARVSVANPMVLNVHDQPYRDALEQLLPNNPDILKLHDTSEAPEDLAREVLGRIATKKGFDSAILRAPDPKNDMILDFKDFKPTSISGLGRGLAGQVTLAKPSGKVFARGEEPPPLEPKTGSASVGELENLDDAARAYGFRDKAEMATAWRASRWSPFEMLRAASKMPRAPLPDLYVGDKSVSSLDLRRLSPETYDAIQAVADRFPWISNRVASIRVAPLASRDLALTHVDSKGFLRIELNQGALPSTPAGKASMARYGYTDPREFVASTMEHEVTHVAQYWLTVKGLSGTFGVPDMRTPIGSPEDIETERQAYDRDSKLKQFFDTHRETQARVELLPEAIKTRLALEEAEAARQVMRPIVRKRYNRLIGKLDYRVQAKTTGEVGMPASMDDFDIDSRKLNDTQFDPDNLLGPVIKSTIKMMNDFGLKWGSAFRSPIRASDDPNHIGFIAKVWEHSSERQIKTDQFNRRLARIIKQGEVSEKNFDEFGAAVHGLRRMGDGTLVQTAKGVGEKIGRAAIALREHIYDPLFEMITGVDRRAPAILRDLGLEESPKTWNRIKLIQDGRRLGVSNSQVAEFTAAERMKGMLNFDESHDLRTQFVEGYLTLQPIANERAELIDQIRQIDQTGRYGGLDEAESQVLRAKRLQRLTEVEVGLAKRQVGSLPARDVLPEKGYFGPMLVKDHPGAAEVLVDKDLSSVLGRYVNGAVSKRFFDQSLFEFRKVADQLAAPVRDYDVNYLNNLRGVKGYREDMAIVGLVNGFNKTVGLSKRIDIGAVRTSTRQLMQLNNYFKLYFNQVRFPLIQMSHVGLTSMVVDPLATTKGIAYTLAKPKRAFLEAMAAGVIDRDPEFLGAMDEVSPMTRPGMLKRGVTAMSKYSDYFRKAVTYHGFRLRALDPDFQPQAVIRSFIKDVPGRNTIEMSRDYGQAAADILQFRLRAEGKPQAFVGGMRRRLWGQFKQWPINIGGLYADIIKSGDKAMMARLAGSMFMFGGLSFGGGEMLYNAVRTQLIKHGYVLPRETGWQLIANQMGIGGALKDVDVMSLRDPIGLPRSIDDLPSFIAGPTFGGIYDFAKGIADADGDKSKIVKTALSALSPQIRAGIDAWEEFKHGGVVTPSGRAVAFRDPSAIIIRGLDLSPSVKVQQQQYKNDIVTALENNQGDTAKRLVDEAQKKGLVFGPIDSREIRGKVRRYLKQQAMIKEEGVESLVR